MSRKPEFVVTGVHVPGVHMWARVLVSPDRLAQVKESVLRYGSASLRRGERLEIETRCGEEQGLAVSIGTIKHFDSRTESSERGRCLVCWNETSGVINVYGDNQDELAAMQGPLVDALVYRDRVELGQVWIDADKVTSIQVGSVLVYFDRPDAEKEKEEEPEDEGKRAWVSEVKRTWEPERTPYMKAPPDTEVETSRVLDVSTASRMVKEARLALERARSAERRA